MNAWFKGKTLVLTVATVVAVSANAGYGGGYRDWRLVEERVEDPAAGGTYRRQSDLTRPMHGPWLTNPAYDAMTVTYISRDRCAAAIEWRKRGEKAWTRRWNTVYGMLDYSSDIHTFHLSGLRPATDYEYRFATANSPSVTAFTDTYVGRETYSFRTLDPARSTYKVFVTTDIHGMMGLVGDPLYAGTDAKDADFCLFLGDNVEDNMNTPRYATTFGFIDGVTRLWGSRKPTVFLRGNHDCWGCRAADGWRDYYARPDGKGYYCISQGPVIFAVFDFAMEHSKRKSAAATEVERQYYADQLAWFEKLKDSDDWQKATFRIALSHYGVRTGQKWDEMMMGFSTALCKPLNETDPKRRTHLLLCGHMHFYARWLPHAKDYYHNFRNETDEKRLKRRTFSAYRGDALNFTEICGERWEGLMLEVSPDKLVVRSQDWRHPGAPDLDAVEILPDGTATARDMPLKPENR